MTTLFETMSDIAHGNAQAAERPFPDEIERVTLLVRNVRTGEQDRIAASNKPRMPGRERWALHQRGLGKGMRLEAIVGEAYR